MSPTVWLLRTVLSTLLSASFSVAITDKLLKGSSTALLLYPSEILSRIRFILKAFLEVCGTLANEIYPASGVFICNLV